jgi:predicted MPP superfamily phosphohydrolase
LLSHSPDQFPRAARWGIDLVLSGHNHAGQIRFPLVGPIFMPSIYSRRFDRGFFRSGRSLLYVSQGVAGQHPIRYGGCLPEVTRLVLRAAAPARGSAAPAGAELAGEAHGSSRH